MLHNTVVSKIPPQLIRGLLERFQLIIDPDAPCVQVSTDAQKLACYFVPASSSATQSMHSDYLYLNTAPAPFKEQLP